MSDKNDKDIVDDDVLQVGDCIVATKDVLNRDYDTASADEVVCAKKGEYGIVLYTYGDIYLPVVKFIKSNIITGVHYGDDYFEKYICVERVDHKNPLSNASMGNGEVRDRLALIRSMIVDNAIELFDDESEIRLSDNEYKILSEIDTILYNS